MRRDEIVTQKRELPVGIVLRAGDSEPPDGTPLILADETWERYDRSLAAVQFDSWTEYVKALGPFVVAPDYDELVNRTRSRSRRMPPGVEDEFGLTEYDLLGLMF